MIYDEVQPKPEDVAKALEAYIAAVRAHYGIRLHGVVLFGSRARGDHRPDSDADVAIILQDGDWRFWAEKMLLADLTYEALIEYGLRIQPWPVSVGAWNNPELHHNPGFIKAIKCDAHQLQELA